MLLLNTRPVNCVHDISPDTLEMAITAKSLVVSAVFRGLQHYRRPTMKWIKLGLMSVHRYLLFYFVTVISSVTYLTIHV